MPYPNVNYNPGFNAGYPRYNTFGAYQPPVYPGRPMYGGDPMMYQNAMPQQQQMATQPQQTQQMTQQPIQTQATTPNISASPNQVWVNGMEGAKAYPMIPNTSVMLMDSENLKFYIKTADMGGKRTIETYVYQKEDENGVPLQPQNPPISEQLPTLTKDDIIELENRLMAKFDGIQAGYDDIIAAVNSFGTKATATGNSNNQKQTDTKEKDRDRDKK